MTVQLVTPHLSKSIHFPFGRSKRLIQNLFVLLTSCIFASGCAVRQYQEAALKLQPTNPHASLEYLVKAWEGRPNDPQTRAHVDQALKSIIRDYGTKIETLPRTGAYDVAIAECYRVLTSARLVEHIAPIDQITHSIQQDRLQFAELAAEQYYQRARAHEAENRTREAIEAYDRCLGYRANFKDAEDRRTKLLGDAVVNLFIEFDVLGPELDIARMIRDELGPRTAMFRPRFLQIVNNESLATSHCVVRVQSADVHDSGWITTVESGSVIIEKKDPETGQLYKIEKNADWAYHTRELTLEIAAQFSVVAQREKDPQPLGSSLARASTSATFTTWIGDIEAVPEEILEFPHHPVEPEDIGSLAMECTRSAAQDLAYQLVQAYK